MKIKRMAVAFMAVQLIFSNAYAASITDLQTSVSFADKSLSISGGIDATDGTAATEVLVKLLRPGKRDVDIKNDKAGEASSLVAVDRISIAKGQTKFEGKIGLKSGLPEGRYYIYFSGNGLTAPEKPSEMWYYAPETLESETRIVVSSLTKDELKSNLFDDEDIYPEDTTDPLYDRADRLSLKGMFYSENLDDIIAQVIYNERAKINSYANLLSAFETASVMANFEMKNTAAVVDSDYRFKKDIFQYDEFTGNEDEYKKIFELFSNDLNLKGRQNVINSLSSIHWTNISDYKVDFAKQAVYNAVYNNVAEGFGHIPDVITTYGSLTNTDFSDFNALSSADKLKAANVIKQSNAGSFDELCSVIKSSSKPTTSNGSNSSTNTSKNSRGTGSSIGISPDYMNDLKDQSEMREQEWAGGYSDIDGYDWAKEAIEYLTDKGVVSGIGDNKFGPGLSIKREEFAKMLAIFMNCDTKDIKIQPETEFSDVDKSSWYAPYVYALKEKGIVTGDENNNFMVGRDISRQDVCTMIYRIAQSFAGTDYKLEFSDSDSISEYAKEAVAALSDKKIVQGDENGLFSPSGSTTRAEAAVIFYRLYMIGGVSE